MRQERGNWQEFVAESERQAAIARFRSYAYQWY
jgi:hypothetical protein